MSKAVRCDRCQEYFMMEEIQEDCARIENIWWRNRKSYADGKFTKCDQELDLCPSCAMDFEKFMDGCELAIHENDFDTPSADVAREVWDREKRKIEKEKEEALQECDEQIRQYKAIQEPTHSGYVNTSAPVYCSSIQCPRFASCKNTAIGKKIDFENTFSTQDYYNQKGGTMTWTARGKSGSEDWYECGELGKWRRYAERDGLE